MNPTPGAVLEADPVPPQPAATHGSPDQLGLLAGALAKAQAELPTIPRTKTATIRSEKANYTYQYAELGNILALARPVLGKHGLAVTQLMVDHKLITWLMHEAGGRLESILDIPTFNLPQALGSWLTYMRRYTISALLGIAPEDDDDGSVAQDNPPLPHMPAPRPPKPAPIPTPAQQRDDIMRNEVTSTTYFWKDEHGNITAPNTTQPVTSAAPPVDPGQPGLASPLIDNIALGRLIAKQKERSCDDATYRTRLLKEYGIHSRKSIPADKVPTEMTWLAAYVAPPAPTPPPTPTPNTTQAVTQPATPTAPAGTPSEIQSVLLHILQLGANKKLQIDDFNRLCGEAATLPAPIKDFNDLTTLTLLQLRAIEARLSQ